MPPLKPGWLRLARRLQAAHEQRVAAPRRPLRDPWMEASTRFDQLTALRRQIGKAEARGWRLAMLRLCQRLPGSIRAVELVLNNAKQQCQPVVPQPPPLREWLAELHQVEDDFGAITIDAARLFLAVATDPIVLEKTSLGAFSLRLHWPRIADGREADCFEIVALDEGRASAANPNVPHPHVRDGHLCAGDATAAMQRAIGEGRLFDAFALIRSVLENYNPHSAFVTLADWLGFSCDSCGCRLDPDDRCACDRCGRDVCGECTSRCECCGVCECETCQGRCGVCEAHWCARRLVASARSSLRCCPNCLRTCSACGAEVASSELDEGAKQCEDCRAATGAEDDIHETHPMHEGEDE